MATLVKAKKSKNTKGTKNKTNFINAFGILNSKEMKGFDVELFLNRKKLWER